MIPELPVCIVAIESLWRSWEVGSANLSNGSDPLSYIGGHLWRGQPNFYSTQKG